MRIKNIRIFNLFKNRKKNIMNLRFIKFKIENQKKRMNQVVIYYLIEKLTHQENQHLLINEVVNQLIVYLR